MALWSMAKSPLMYGGDLTHLDNSTLSIITNPTLLKINHHSKNNMEFHDVYKERTSKEHSGRFRSPYHVHLTKNDGMFVGLTACSDGTANGWYVVSQDGKPDHICRNYEMQDGKSRSFCLGKTKPLLASDIIIMDSIEHQSKFHLSVRNTGDTCLDASAGQRRSASDIRFPIFSACRWHAKQMWELNANGNLVSSYSGLCATVESRDEGGTIGARAWVATGRKGGILLEDPSRYGHIVGNLVYLTVTRPDIAHAVHILSQFVCAPTSVHFGHLLRVLRLLYPTWLFSFCVEIQEADSCNSVQYKGRTSSSCHHHCRDCVASLAVDRLWYFL